MNKVLVRLKNKKVLLSIVSGILLILVNLGLIDLELSAKIDTTVNTILVLLVGLGIISDPESHVKG